MRMHQVEVSARVWDGLRALKEGRGPPRPMPGWRPAEQAAFELYAPLADRGPGPVTVAQIGQSLDGRVATVSGDARDVSGPDGLAHLHRMRALMDAVVIGVRTALHDRPRMTVRLCEGTNPARVVIDPRGRLPNDAPLLQAPDVRRIVVQAVDTARPEGVEVIRLRGRDGVLDAPGILSALRAAGLDAIMIEGGGTTIARFIEAGVLTRLHVAVAPILIGDGQASLTLPNPVAALSEALRPDTRVFSLPSDILFDCDMGSVAPAAGA
jgi:riboflavin-specific deaminase-like protein